MWVVLFQSGFVYFMTLCMYFDKHLNVISHLLETIISYKTIKESGRAMHMQLVKVQNDFTHHWLHYSNPPFVATPYTRKSQAQ